MIPLIDILIILSGISAAQAGPMRRYTNSTSQASDNASGVPYNPAANSPSLSLPHVDGITTLPLSLLADSSTELHIKSETPPSTANELLTITENSVSFTYQPQESDTTCTQSDAETAPTSFWTFGDQQPHPKKPMTVTSTAYTTVLPSSQVLQSTDIHPSGPKTSTSQQGNTTSNTAPAPSWRTSFIFDPLPTTSSELPASSVPPQENSKPTDPSTSTTFAYPYPSSESKAAPPITSTEPSDPPSSTSAMPFDASEQLPEVVTEGAPVTQSEQETLVTNGSVTSAVPGITIVPQNPSVIYITVTEAGATTTVTA